MSKPLNQQLPFARVYADIPTDVAVRLDDAARKAGKSKKQFVADAIVAACDALVPAAPAVSTAKRRSTK